MTDWLEDLKEDYEDKVAYAVGFNPPPRPRRARPPADRVDRATRRGARRAAGADAAPAPRLPLGPRADGADDRPAHGRGGLRGRRRRATPATPAKLLDELGDLLFQVYFLALLLEEQGEGDLEQVARAVHAKLVRRHPHVFGEAEAAPPGACASAGRRSRPSRKGAQGIFHDVPASLPALLHARKVQRRAAAVGFEWPDLAGPLAKVGRSSPSSRPRCADAASPAPRPSPTRRSRTRSATCSSRSSTSRGG